MLGVAEFVAVTVWPVAARQQRRVATLASQVPVPDHRMMALCCMRQMSAAGIARHRPSEREAGASVRPVLLFEQDLHPVRRLDLDDPVGPVLARPLRGYLESET